MSRPAESVSPDRRIKQKWGRRTYDALIETGFALLEHRELEAISIAEFAKAAGYSTGAFYTRFRSKDEFFDATMRSSKISFSAIGSTGASGRFDGVSPPVPSRTPKRH